MGQGVEELRARIMASARGKVTIKLKTLVCMFGYESKAQVRSSSLDAVLAVLADASIACDLAGGRSANDYATLSTSGGDNAAALGLAPAKASTPTSSVFELEPRKEYRILSLHPPWAWAIIFAGKDIENRTWTPRYDGPILIHASSKPYVGDKLADARREIAQKGRIPLAKVPDDFPRCTILGAVDVVGFVKNSKSAWAYPGAKHWVLRNPRPLTKPVRNVDGKLNLWRWVAP